MIIDNKHILNLTLTGIEALPRARGNQEARQTLKTGFGLAADNKEAVERKNDSPSTLAGGTTGIKRGRGRPRKNNLEKDSDLVSAVDEKVMASEQTMTSASDVSDKSASYDYSEGNNQPAAAGELDLESLPPELNDLPEKHKEFYWRKLAEYREIYKPAKAQSEAIEMVRRVTG